MQNYKPVFNYIEKTLMFYFDNTEIKTTISLDYLIRKIMMDFGGIEILIDYNPPRPLAPSFLQQSFTIARSMIESSIHFIYLLQFEAKRLQYQEDSQMLLFKNDFLTLKHFKDGSFELILDEQKHTLKDLEIAFTQDGFSKLTKNNQQLLLKTIENDKFELTESSWKKLDIFFKNLNKTHTHSSIEHMYKELQGEIDFEGKNLRTITYDDYNKCSQFTHTIYPIRHPELYNLIRICFSICNILGAAIIKKYKLEIPKELANEMLECYNLLHPEDKNNI